MGMEKQAGSSRAVGESKGKKRAGDALPAIAKRPKMRRTHVPEPLIADHAAQKQPWRPSPALLKQICSLRWGSFRIGTSGYAYKHWKSVVYPGDSNPKDWFQLYAELFDTVEINNSFYRLPSPQAVDSWRSQAPPGFCFALKFSRYGTHMKRLKDPEGPISLFLERATRLGDDFLGPILVQLPPKFELDIGRLTSFLEKVPKRHRWAMEFRDPSWLCDEVYSSLRAHGVSLCIHDHEDITVPHPKVLTTNWTYLRFHGCNYQNRYKLHELQASAAWIKDMLRKGLDVYAYFNNDFNGYAPINALELRDLVYQTGAE